METRGTDKVEKNKRMLKLQLFNYVADTIKRMEFINARYGAYFLNTYGKEIKIRFRKKLLPKFLIGTGL